MEHSWRVFQDRSLLERCFRGFVLPILEYCSAVWCSAADTHLKLLDRAVSGDRFLTEGVFECDIAHRRSVAVQCILYKIRCNPVHPLMMLYLDHMCQWGLPAVLWSHIGTLIHRLAAEPRFTAGLLFPSRYPSGTILLTPYSMVWDWRVSRARPILFYWPKRLYPYYSLLLFSLSLLSVYRLIGIVWLGSSDWYGVCHSLSTLHCRPFLIIIIIIIRVTAALWILYLQPLGIFIISAWRLNFHVDVFLHRLPHNEVPSAAQRFSISSSPVLNLDSACQVIHLGAWQYDVRLSSNIYTPCHNSGWRLGPSAMLCIWTVCIKFVVLFITLLIFYRTERIKWEYHDLLRIVCTSSIHSFADGPNPYPMLLNSR